MFDVIYKLDEHSTVKHFRVITDQSRYDFSLVYTSQFFGKTLVTCIQSGTTSLCNHTELTDIIMIKKTFNIHSLEDASIISTVLQNQIPDLSYFEQY